VRDLAVLFLHLLVTIARLAGPGGVRSVVAESVLIKHQLLILNRSRKQSPNLCRSDRVAAGLCAIFIRPGRVIRSAIVFKPSTLLKLHRMLIQRKYRRLFGSKEAIKPGPKGPSREVIAAVVDMKQRNPSWGVHGSPSKSRWPSVCRSTEMACDAFWRLGTSRSQTPRGCPSRIRCQAATGSCTRLRQWETHRTLFKSAGATVFPSTKVSGAWPSNDAWLRAAL
jgi:hypothetical protein